MTNLAHGVPVEELCQTHRTSIHAESHQEMANIVRGNWNSVLGHIRYGEVDPTRLRRRHDEVAQYLNHNPDTKWKPQNFEDPMGIDPELFGVPAVALELYQRIVFRMKDCDCFKTDTNMLSNEEGEAE